MTDIKKTRCPHCHTAFKITEQQLQAAGGKVRCGKCFKVFNGKECLIVEPPTAPSHTFKQQPPKKEVADDDFLIDDNFDISLLEASEKTATPAAGNPAPAANEPEPDTGPLAAQSYQPVQSGEPAAASAKTFAPIEQPADKAETAHPLVTTSNPAPEQTDDETLSDDAPEEVVFVPGSPMSTLTEELEELTLDRTAMTHWRPETESIIPEAEVTGRSTAHRARLSTWLWLAGCVIASTTLVLQLIYFNSLAIDRDSPLWSASTKVCAVLGCPLPTATDLDKILSTNLVVRSHPTVASALLVDAVIVNTADFPQPFPPLTLTFENLQGDVIASRAFKPEEYLTGELANRKLMPSNKPVELELQIVDPGREAVSFRLFIAK